METTFNIPKFDTKGNKVYNAAGEMVFTQFIYNFNKLGMDRKLIGQRYFELAEKQADFLPNTDKQINVIGERKLEAKAYAAILIRILDNGSEELYDSVNTELSKYELSEIGKTEEEWKMLMDVQNDFFTKIGIISKKQMKEFQNTIMPLMQLVQGLKESGIEIKSPSEMTDLVSLIEKMT